MPVVRVVFVISKYFSSLYSTCFDDDYENQFDSSIFRRRFFNESNELLSSLYVFFVVQKEHFVVIFFVHGLVRRKETSSPKREKEYRKRSRIQFYQNFFINFEPFYHPLRGADFGLVGSRELHAKYEARVEGGERERRTDMGNRSERDHG